MYLGGTKPVALGPLVESWLHTIRLQFSRHIGHYIQSLPIHKSQTLIQKTASSMVFELKCRLTYELFNLIMKYGAEVKVLGPESLAEWVKEEHLKSIQLYDKN
jgi:predicted DNA-binding transcriptional regulator YafY